MIEPNLISTWHCLKCNSLVYSSLSYSVMHNTKWQVILHPTNQYFNNNALKKSSALRFPGKQQHSVCNLKPIRKSKCDSIHSNWHKITPLADTYSAHSINDGGGSVWLLAIVQPGLLAHQCPQLVQVDGGAVSCVPLQVVVSHTHLTEVPRMAGETHRKDIFILIIPYLILFASIWQHCSKRPPPQLGFHTCFTPVRW